MVHILIAAELTQDVLDRIAVYGQLHFAVEQNAVLIEKNVLLKRIRETNPDVCIVDATPMDAEILRSAKNLKFLHCTRGNPVNIDRNYCKKTGILVGNSPGRNANAVAEFTFGLMINLMRKITIANRRLLEGEFLLQGHWEEERGRPVEDIIWKNPSLPVMPYYEFQSIELAGKTLGLLGFGAIGALIAEKARVFDLKVLAYDPYTKKSPPDYVNLVSLDELASQSDIVSLHAKETRETIHIVNKDFFGQMKTGSYLINTSRGKLIDRHALVEALRSQKLSGAALDVFDYEPLCRDDPLLVLDNLLLTPHIGGASHDVIRHHSLSTIKNIESYFAHKELIYPCS